MVEALAVGFKEGLKVWVVWLVFGSYLALNRQERLLRPFWAGLSAAFLLSISLLFLPQGVVGGQFLGNCVATSFAFFFMAGMVALLHASGTRLFGKNFLSSGRYVTPVLAQGIVVSAALLFFFPDMAGSLVFLRDAAFMKGAAPAVFGSALAGFLVTTALFFAAKRFIKKEWLGSFFDYPQLLLFLAMVKLLGGGTKGLAEFSLVPSVQHGLMKFFHDIVHQTFVLLMVPDHPLLKTTVWNFIAIFFGPNVASYVALFLFLLFPLAFLRYSLLSPVPERKDLSGAELRKSLHKVLSDRRKKAVPVIFFICLILFAWFSGSGESVTMLYQPDPVPVVAEGGMVSLPLHDPAMDLMDGMLHKFSLTYQGQTIRILVIRKPNRALAVCLDACEVCPPRGYGQREDKVVCIYCGTPIPVETLDEPGGCNPIPLSFKVDDRFITIDMGELMKKWRLVKSGKGKWAAR